MSNLPTIVPGPAPNCSPINAAGFISFPTVLILPSSPFGSKPDKAAKGRGDCNGTNDVMRVISYIYKNGAELMNSPQYTNISNPANFFTPFVSGVVDMNGSSDYVEFFINVLISSGTPNVFGDSSLRTTTFGAYRIGS